MSKKKSDAQLDAEIKAMVVAGGVYWPSKSKGRGSPVVKPHRRTSDTCTTCGRFHSAADHAKHGDPPPATPKTPGRAPARKPKASAAAGSRSRESKEEKRDKIEGLEARASSIASVDPRDDAAILSRVDQIVPTVKMAGDRKDTRSLTGRFTPDKVFISAVWKKMSGDPKFLAVSREDFERAILSGMRTGKISLARADVVGAMNPSEVKGSEISSRGATFHFIIDKNAKW